MDWAAASGAPLWGAASADHGPTMLSFAGPSSSSAAAAAEARLQDFAVGLAQRARPAGAGRRSRSGAGGAEACSVDGCRSGLSRCREYHRRHRVCEAHSKTPVVVVGGQEQRFCQQCSRFHMLSEFDEGKRSCRKRLDGHNRRRRKPQHDLTNLGGFFPYHQVNQLTARQNFDAMYLVDRQPSFSISFSRTPKQFPFPQDGGGMLSASRHGHFLVEDSSHSGSSACNNDLSGTLGPECALSLLSSSLHHPSPAGQAQVSSALSRIASASSQQVAITAATTAFASGGSHHVFGTDAVLEDPSQTLPFPWQ